MRFSEIILQRFKLGQWLLRGAGLGLVIQCCAGWYSPETNRMDFVPESAGVRTGFTGTSRGHNFHQVEAFGNWDLPWNWDLGRQWSLQTELALSAGWLADPGKNAAILTLGPGAAVKREDFPLSVEAGWSPTFVSEHEFATKDLGSDFAFTSYIGLNVDLGCHFRLGYRFQHMSNGGIATKNPGLNLHAVAVSYRF